jgi:60 kDa SS-A/Ro ribonucleoprotein
VQTYTQFSTRRTPQSQPIPASTQVANSAGGHSWQVDDWTRLDRFLVLGSEGGTYYAAQPALTRENAEGVIRCIGLDGPRAVAQIVAVSVAGRAPKNDPAIFALAMCAGLGDEATRKAALDALPEVCRIGTHLFNFATYVEQFRGWGRGLRRAVGAWYQRDDVDALAYQAVKYRQRNGWTHRDLLRLAHPDPTTKAHGNLYHWITTAEIRGDVPAAVHAYAAAQRATSRAETFEAIRQYGSLLPREALNPAHLTDPVVWSALLEQGMPMTALLRNLATMTRVGLLKPMSEASRLVVEQLGDGERLRKARVHPLSILAAMGTYAQGHGERDPSKTWAPVASILDALDGAFYAAFGNVEPTGKRTMLALDLSGSMGFAPGIAGMPSITPRVGAAAMSLVTAAAEPKHMIVGFTGEGPGAWQQSTGGYNPWGHYSNVTPAGLCPLPISPRQRLSDVTAAISAERFGPTDCALPMLYAQANGIAVDTFIVYTDSETWCGSIHPSQALREYREKTGIDAKLVVVGMVSNGFTIADPNDAGMLDVVGFDTAAPQVISAFSAPPRLAA